MAITLEGTRLKIPAFIQKQRSATVDQIAQELDLSSATIRRHLDILTGRSAGFP